MVTKQIIRFLLLALIMGCQICQIQTRPEFEKKHCVRLKVIIEYHEMAILKSYEYHERVETREAFIRENEEMGISGEVGGTFRSISGAVRGGYRKALDRSYETRQSNENISEKTIEFQKDYLQLARKEINLITVNGHTAKVSTRLHIASSYRNESKKFADLLEFAHLEIVRTYGHKDGHIRWNTYTDTKCVKGDCLKSSHKALLV